MHDRPDKVPWPRLVGIKSDGGALVARHAAPCAPCLGEEIEAEPSENAVEERQIGHDPVPGLFHQDGAFVILEIGNPETFRHGVNSCGGTARRHPPRFALPRTAPVH